MPIPNRYYEAVRGWAPSLVLRGDRRQHRFQPITDKVRQVDYHGGYTAAAGHALYTARNYPQEYWNRTAFVASRPATWSARSCSAATAATSARRTRSTCSPATTSGPRRSWPRSAPTATSG